MEDPIDQLIKSAQEVRLPKEVSIRMRERLVSYMQQHPVSIPRIPSPYQRFLSVFSPTGNVSAFSFATLSLFLVITAGAIVTFASEGALPGDPLYSVKISVLEPAHSLLAFTPEEKVAWNISVTETRLQEVENLAANEKLSPEEGVQSQKRFDDSLKATRATLDTLARGNPGAAAKIDDSFSSSLDAHERVLTNLSVSASSTSASSTEETTVFTFAKHFKEEVRARKANRDIPQKKVPEDTPAVTATSTVMSSSTPTQVTSTTSEENDFHASSTTSTTTVSAEVRSEDSSKSGDEDSIVSRVRRSFGF